MSPREPEASATQIESAAELACAIALLDAPAIDRLIGERGQEPLWTLLRASGSNFQSELAEAISWRLRQLANGAPGPSGLLRDAPHFRIPRIEESCKPGESLMALLLFCRQGDAAQEGLGPKALASDPSPPRIKTLAALERAGWAPLEADFLRLFEKACFEIDPGVVAWIAESGGFFDSVLKRARREPHHLVRALERESERSFAALDRLIDAGVLIDSPDCLGVSDFLLAGRVRLARALVHNGFAARACVADKKGLPAADALAIGLCSPDSPAGIETLEQRAAFAAETVRWLASGGVPFAPDPQRGRSNAHEPDPLAALASQRHTPFEVSEALLRAFVAAGADPAQSSALLPTILSNLRSPDGDRRLFDLALELGARPDANPAALLAAPLSWGSAATGWELLRWQSELIAMGADPTACAESAPAPNHPIAAAVASPRGSAWDYAARLLELGAPIQWRDPESSETLLHLLAGGKDELAAPRLELLLERPGASDLINAADAWGRTPLMIACSEGRLAMAEILARSGALLDARDRDGQTALHHAARSFRSAPQVVAALLPYNPDLSIVNFDGQTSAQLMAQSSSLPAAALLLERRPQDACALDPAGLATRAALEGLGAAGLAVFERCAMASLGSAARPARGRSL